MSGRQPDAAAGPAPGPGTAPFLPGRPGGDWVRGLRTAALLGWRVESNWTDPSLFLIYTVAKPIASLLLLAVMVHIVGGGDEEIRAFVILGSALWATLVAGISGPAWSVIEDRERYRMLKYLYVSPTAFLLLLVGRGAARLAAGAMGSAVALAFAALVLGLRLDVGRVDWLLLAVSLLLGLAPVIALGVVIAAICLQARQESWSYPEAAAGALFLVSGVVFPLAVLPEAVQALALANPVTWWVAGARLALLPDGPSSIGGPGSLWTAVTGSAAPDPATVLIALFATGAVVTLAATAVFRSSERRARDRGLLDMTTGS